MSKKLTQEEFINRAKTIHGDKYDYSKVKYVNMNTKVCIICPKHGEFWQTPNSHIYAKHNCFKCSRSKTIRPMCGIGINDLNGFVPVRSKAYQTWRNMIWRCYRINPTSREKSYQECDVCEEWLYFSNFKKWFDKNYVFGYALDKDILIKGNKVYSPETCCFIPSEINLLIQDNKGRRSPYAKGVSIDKRDGGYNAVFWDGVKKTSRRANTIKDAFSLYKQSKELHIKRVAIKYFQEGKITQKVYQALIDYDVEIND